MVIRKLKNWLAFEGKGARRKVSAQVTKVVMLRFIYNIWVTTIFPVDGALSHLKIWTIFFLSYLQFLNRDTLGIKSMRVQRISLRWSLPDTAEKLGACKMPPRYQISGIPLFSGTGNWGKILCSGKGVQEPRLFMYRGRRARRHSFDFRHREVGHYILSAFSTVWKGITSDYLLPKLFNVLAIHFTEVECKIQKTHVLWPNLLLPPHPPRFVR